MEGRHPQNIPMPSPHPLALEGSTTRTTRANSAPPRSQEYSLTHAGPIALSCQTAPRRGRAFNKTDPSEKRKSTQARRNSNPRTRAPVNDRKMVGPLGAKGRQWCHRRLRAGERHRHISFQTCIRSDVHRRVRPKRTIKIIKIPYETPCASSGSTTPPSRPDSAWKS
jgi:hypothetical protein